MGGREEGKRKEGTTKEQGEMAKEILLNIFCRQSVLKVDMDRRFGKTLGNLCLLASKCLEIALMLALLFSSLSYKLFM